MGDIQYCFARDGVLFEVLVCAVGECLTSKYGKGGLLESMIHL